MVVPRPDLEPRPVEAVSSSLDAAARVGLRPVLCTSGWPPLAMTDRWREAVIDLVREAEHRLEPPVLMAELPAIVFEELRRDYGQIFRVPRSSSARTLASASPQLTKMLHRRPARWKR
ncbi:MAG: hypothetical protein A2148_00235 [Chloroflexi bacterium RBG_16_68_14]|nr:MAG: hypothetical protein A2148_00235 [Chloroflexi bacterium RBG_16_68_14]